MKPGNTARINSLSCFTHDGMNFYQICFVFLFISSSIIVSLKKMAGKMSGLTERAVIMIVKVQ